MAIKLNNQIGINLRETFEGKKEKILLLNCENCEYLEEIQGSWKKCILCLLKALFASKNINFNYLSLGASNKEINFSSCIPIFNYFKKMKKIESLIEKIKKLREKKCIYKAFQCKVFPNNYFEFTISKDHYIDPIFVYDLIKGKLDHCKMNTKLDMFCTKCLKLLRSSLKSLLNILSGLEIIKDYVRYQNKVKNLHITSNFYSEHFFEHQFGLSESRVLNENQEPYRDNLVETYNIGKQDLFKILIYKIPNEFEKFYEAKFSFQSELEENYYLKIIKDVGKNIELLNLNKIVSLSELIKIYKNNSIQYINSKYNFSNQKKKKIALLTAIQKLNLQKLFPFLIDDYVEEIFLDSPYDQLYLDHQKFGRCRTRISFNSKEIERIKTLIRLYSGKRIDYANPSIKVVLNNKYFYCRFAIDTEPINLNDFSLDIRKLNKNIFTIQDLLKNGTLSPLIAAYIYFNIIRRFNITVTGETNTGKTTLINALDLLLPKDFRKIYVESITESLNQFKFERHQLKYKIDSSEALFKQKFSKQNQIKKLLHRTPDIIYLGEILTKGEAKAMFHCLAAGLRGFQTIHSSDLDSLINRFLFHYEIEKICLKDLDLIVLMKKIQEKRKLICISEIDDDNNSKSIYRRIFEYNPESDKWDLLIDLFNTNSLKKIRKIESFDSKKFYRYIQIYEEIFELLLKAPSFTLKELLTFFDKVAFFSLKSIEKLDEFWNSWHRSRSLNY